jgi:hypothetical protein
MQPVVRALILVQVVVFAAASLLHRGIPVSGFESPAAAIAEAIIAVVLAAGLALTWIARRRARAIALAVQAFALIGTGVGLFVILRGRGPSTALDLVIHLAMVALLVAGLWLTWSSGVAGRRTVAA